jgi:hypothetical protein
MTTLRDRLHRVNEAFLLDLALKTPASHEHWRRAWEEFRDGELRRLTKLELSELGIVTVDEDEP